MKAGTENTVRGVYCFITIVVLADFSVTSADKQLMSHTDVYDITTIYNRRPEYNNIKDPDELFDLEQFNCSIEIHSMTNAIGMPIEFNGLILSSKNKSLEFIADKNYNNSIFTRNTVNYNTQNWQMSTLSMPDRFSTDVKYNLLLWQSDEGIESFNIKWTQYNTIGTCISVSYVLKDKSICTLSMNVLRDETVQFSHDFERAKQLTTVVIRHNSMLLENTNYSLNLNLTKNSETRITYPYGYRYDGRYETVYASGCIIGIKRIALCAEEYENKEVYTMPEKDVRDMSETEMIANVYPFGDTPKTSSSSSSSATCLNGGFEYNQKCTCPPGSKGDNCDYICGPNTFGADCSGMCSMFRTQCKWKKLCTNRFGCTCPAGYTGRYCANECARGKYGVNCNQRCTENCNAGACDIYTGKCTEGCTPSYILPNCTEKYQWLNTAPQLSNSTFDSLKLKLNFNSENVNGSKTMRSIYYQVVYKPTVSESEFQYTNLMEIKQELSAEVTIDGLKPGTSYTVGAILISEDGNYNTRDIETVNYSTMCQLPKNADYNVNLTSGTDYINVTWNQLDSQVENNCKITKYILKLTYGGDGENKRNMYSVQVKTRNNVMYTFKNLLSGQEYGVTATTVSAIDQTKMLKTSYISTRLDGYVKIKNINAELLNNLNAMSISWDIDSDEYKDVPITYTVKYKANKYFSCSYKIIKNNWTSVVVHNQTKRRILDLTPNTQYVVKIEPEINGHTYNKNENVIYVKTANSAPKLLPVYDEVNSNVTNQTASISWTINMEECINLNGLFLGYRVILQDTVDDTQIVSTINKNTVSYIGLKPDTKYELRVYVETNFGIDLEQDLLITFKTKSKLLVPVNDLIVYKKNLKDKSFGIRWSFPGEYSRNADGFIITAVAADAENNTNFTKITTVNPEKCSAWPTFYCATLKNLSININQYQINIQAKSLDYPAGGLSASTVGDFNDGISDKPGNLRTTHVDSDHIVLEWDIPLIFNGVPKSFIVNVEEIGSIDSTECCEDSKPDVEIPITEEIPTYNHTIYNLKSGSTYSIGVLTKTSSYGQANRIHVKTTA